MKMTMDQDVIMSRPKQQAMQKLVAQDDVTMLNKLPMKRTTNENESSRSSHNSKANQQYVKRTTIENNGTRAKQQPIKNQHQQKKK